MQEKLIYISNPTEVNNYLEEGWSIKNISATKNNGTHGCYVHLVKNQSYENRNTGNSQ